MPGPVPKREDQRRRQNKDNGPITKGQARGAAFIPAAPEHWHDLASQLYDAIENSGQSEFFEQSDWAYAQIVCEALSRELNKGQRMSAQMFQSIQTAMSNLLVTEGDRRRLRVELSKAPEADPDAEFAESERARFAAEYGIE